MPGRINLFGAAVIFRHPEMANQSIFVMLPNDNLPSDNGQRWMVASREGVLGAKHLMARSSVSEQREYFRPQRKDNWTGAIAG